jgi:hypothetical protein
MNAQSHLLLTVAERREVAARVVELTLAVDGEALQLLPTAIRWAHAWRNACPTIPPMNHCRFGLTILDSGLVPPGAARTADPENRGIAR